MRKTHPWRLIYLGVILLLCGIILALGSSPAQAQEEKTTAEYVGSRSCGGCHKDLSKAHALSPHALALQDVSKDKSAIKADFTQGEKERTVQFSGESGARPFTADDVAFVIGSGRYVERYLYRVDRSIYLVFPAEWNVAAKKWQPYTPGSKWPDDAAFNWTQNCAGCHTTGLDPERGRWEDEGVQCEACHGPASVHVELAVDAGKEPSEADLKKLRETMLVTPDAQVCGQCHSRGTEPEKKMPYAAKYRPGMNLLDSGIFALVASDSQDHWWVSGHAKLDNMQFNEWALTGHAKALETLKSVKDTAKDLKPACLSCHSTDYAFTNRLIEAQKAGTRKGEVPALPTVDTAKFGVTCVSCHDPHTDTGPIEGKTTLAFNLVSEPYALCVSCHRDNEVTEGIHHPVQEMFEGKSVIQEVEGIPSPHFTDPKGPRCQTCHMPRVPIESFTLATHLLKPIAPGLNIETLKDSCTICHNDMTADAMVEFVNDTKTETETRLKALKSALKDDSPAWVRTAIEFVEDDGSKGIHNHRYTAALLNAAEIALNLVKAPQPPGAPSDRHVQDPAECAECHQTQHQLWITSPHAKASLNDTFRVQFAKLGQPTYCMGCHASGYDSKTGKYVFDGVICSTCHYTENQAKHPPAPVILANRSSDCGSCHSGAHSPTYDEWVISAHSAAQIDCVDCHTPHNNGLKQVDINTTCGNCHKDALVDPVHMGKDLDCTDCHMKRERDAQNVFLIRTGHSMSIDPGTCATCHGKVHVLSVREQNGGAAPEDVAQLKAELEQVKSESQINWATGLAGGVVGVLVVGVLGFVILRRGKIL